MLPSMSWWNEKEMRLFLSTNVFIYYTRESAAVDIVGITWASLGSSWRIPTTGCKRQLSCRLLKKSIYSSAWLSENFGYFLWQSNKKSYRQ